MKNFVLRLPILMLLTCSLYAQAPAGYAQAPVPHTLRVAAAADLEPVLPAVLDLFAQGTKVHADVTYQSSATLTQQILNGSPFDIFLAADTGFPQKLVAAGLTTENKPVIYARGTLVLWARKDAPVLHGLPLSFAVLRNPALRSVAIANPAQAPYGRAAQSAIATLFLTSTLAPKLRIASNVAQAAQFANTGNAEVGFLSLTSASTPRLQNDGSYLTVPAAMYPPIAQGAVVLRAGPNHVDAERLLQFLATSPVRSMMAKNGLQPPQ